MCICKHDSDQTKVQIDALMATTQPVHVSPITDEGREEVRERRKVEGKRKMIIRERAWKRTRQAMRKRKVTAGKAATARAIFEVASHILHRERRWTVSFGVVDSIAASEWWFVRGYGNVQVKPCKDHLHAVVGRPCGSTIEARCPQGCIGPWTMTTDCG